MKKLLFAIFLLMQAVGAMAATGDLMPERDGDLWGYKQFGEWVIAPRFNSAKPFQEGLASVSLMGKFGFINKEGKSVVPFKYEEAFSFYEGLAAVKLIGKWGYINNDGELIIPHRFDSATSFSNGLAKVTSQGKKGFIDKGGSWYASETETQNSYKFFVKQYVESQVNEWQLKGRYEKTEDWKKRISEANRNALVKKLVAESSSAFLVQQTKGLRTDLSVAGYDADNEVFLLVDSRFGNILVTVPVEEAEFFETHINDFKRENKYFIKGDGVGLSESVFSMDGKQYVYNNQHILQYTDVDVEYEFNPIDLTLPALNDAVNRQNILSRHEKAFAKSDVDVNIPVTGISNNNTFAVIIANENYRREKAVDYAVNDGNMFCEYCKSTLGLPESNIRMVHNATYLDIKAEVDWIENISKVYKGEAKVLFYYAGHGIPDDASKDAYILPVDGYASNSSTGYKLTDLYASLNKYPTKSSVVFLDACFSGSQRNGAIMDSARGVAINVHNDVPEGNLVVISASTGSETAYSYDDQKHGMFTYYLLKILQQTGGAASLGDIADFVTSEVEKRSMIENSKLQTPTVTASQGIGASWKDIVLR